MQHSTDHEFVVNYMSRNPVMAGEMEHASLVAQGASRRQVRNVIVTDGRRAVGVVSTEELKAAPPDAHVGALMNKNVSVISDQATMGEAAQLMAELDVDCLPVTRWDDLIVGILRSKDVERSRSGKPLSCSACGDPNGSARVDGTDVAFCPSCIDRSHPPRDAVEAMYVTLGGGDPGSGLRGPRGIARKPRQLSTSKSNEKHYFM